MTIETTLLAILREQRETNELLRRLVVDRAQSHPFGVPRTMPEVAWPLPLGPSRTGDPVNPCVRPGTICESPATLGDGGSIRVGWQGNGMVAP